MGNALEAYWGAFRYNIFLLLGYVLTVGLSFLQPDSVVSNEFLAGSVFLAFAYLNPEFEIMLFFILPLKIRWLALFAWAVYAVSFVMGGWPARLQIVAAVGNFFIFFGRDLWHNAGVVTAAGAVASEGSGPPGRPRRTSRATAAESAARRTGRTPSSIFVTAPSARARSATAPTISSTTSTFGARMAVRRKAEGDAWAGASALATLGEWLRLAEGLYARSGAACGQVATNAHDEALYLLLRTLGLPLDSKASVLARPPDDGRAPQGRPPCCAAGWWTACRRPT